MPKIKITRAIEQKPPKENLASFFYDLELLPWWELFFLSEKLKNKPVKYVKTKENAYFPELNKSARV